MSKLDKRGQLALSLTQKVEAKIRLSLGRDQDYDIRFLVDRLFQHAATLLWLGPRADSGLSAGGDDDNGGVFDPWESSGVVGPELWTV